MNSYFSLTLDDITVTSPRFSPSDYQRDVEVEAPNNFTPEDVQEFEISLTSSNVQPVDGSGVSINVQGGPTRIIVYDNDCKFAPFRWCTKLHKLLILQSV